MPTAPNMLQKQIFTTIEEAKNFFKEHNVVSYYIVENDKVKMKDLKSYVFGSIILPVFKVSKGIFEESYQKGRFIGSKPSINEENLTVMMGKNKVFMLPVWKCRQFDIAKYNGDDKILQLLLKNENLYNFLHERPLFLTAQDLDLSIPVKEETIIKDIINQKLYNFYTNDIFKYIVPENLRLRFESLFVEQNKYVKPKLPTKLQTNDDILEQAEEEEFSAILNQQEIIEEDRSDLDLDFLKTTQLAEITSEQMAPTIDLDMIAQEAGSDFLVELEDTVAIPDLMEELEDSDYSDMFLKKSLAGFQMSLDEFFFQQPNYHEKPWHKKVNYILYKLETLPTFETYFNLNKYLDNLDPITIPLPQLLNNLKYYFDLYYNTKNAICLYVIYKLFCNTYVNTQQKKSTCRYQIVNNKITFCVFMHLDDFTPDLVDDIKNDPETLHCEIINDKLLTWLVQSNVENFMQEYKTHVELKILEILKPKYHVIRNVTRSMAMKFLSKYKNKGPDV
jgi:hypothetical protein